MMKFFCFGKKGFCEEQKETGLCPQNCPYIDNTGGEYREATMTNAQKIRAMSDEDLAEFLEQIAPMNCDCCVYMRQCRLEYDEETVNYAKKYSCRDGIMRWLQQPAEEDDMPDLKPCPFCGEDKMLEYEVIDHGVEKRPFGFRFTAKVTCMNCFGSCGTHGFHRDKESSKRAVFRAWNRRAGEEDKHEAD